MREWTLVSLITITAMSKHSISSKALSNTIYELLLIPVKNKSFEENVYISDLLQFNILPSTTRIRHCIHSFLIDMRFKNDIFGGISSKNLDIPAFEYKVRLICLLNFGNGNLIIEAWFCLIWVQIYDRNCGGYKGLELRSRCNGHTLKEIKMAPNG